MINSYTNISRKKIQHRLTLIDYVEYLQKEIDKGYGDCTPVYFDGNDDTRIVEFVGGTGYCPDFSSEPLVVLDDFECTERENVVYII